ncbi:MAG TPA: hypothetical protein VIG24_09330 [Acidimicrobiia bacterium]
MSHVPFTTIHAYQRRGLTVIVDIDTDLEPGDLTETAFQFGTTTKAGLSPEAGGNGIEVPVDLSADDLDVAAGHYGWECRATIAGLLTVMATGVFAVSSEPTEVPA